MYIKSYKIRLYPTKEQEQKMLSHDGACRFIWNYMLEKQISRENNNEKPLSAYDIQEWRKISIWIFNDKLA